MYKHLQVTQLTWKFTLGATNKTQSTALAYWWCSR